MDHRSEEMFAKIKPVVFNDNLMGWTIQIKTSPWFSTVHVGDRVYYFSRGTGQFDGTSAPMGEERG